MKAIATSVLAAVVILLVGVFFYYFGPGGTGTIAQLTLGDGTELKVIQRYNDSIGEPYSVDFYLKRPGEPWGWCYIEHEDTRWSSAHLVPDTSAHSIKIYRGSTLRAEYFIDRKTFALYAEYQRELPAPQTENQIPPI
jgi:hypothetical protein